MNELRNELEDHQWNKLSEIRVEFFAPCAEPFESQETEHNAWYPYPCFRAQSDDFGKVWELALNTHPPKPSQGNASRKHT